MHKQKLESALAGGDRRSIGRSNEIVSEVLRAPRQFADLVRCLWSSDAIVKMRAADAIEKISLEKPEWLKEHKADLLALLEETQQQELRWHLAQIVPRLPLLGGELKRAVACLRGFLDDRSSIVRTCALQGLADLARLEPRLRRSVGQLLAASCRTGTAAMKARARRLLAEMEKEDRRANQSKDARRLAH